MGSPCLFTCQQAFKMGHFTGCALKIRIIFMQNLVSVTWEMQAVFDCLVAGILHFFGQFRGQLEVLALAKIHPVGNYFPKKKIVFHYQTFFLLQICSLLDCSLLDCS